MDDCILGYKSNEEFLECFNETVINKCNGCNNFEYEDGIMCCTKFVVEDKEN